MRRMYEYAHLDVGQDNIHVYTSEPKEIDVLLKMVREWVPDCEMTTRALPSGEIYGYFVRQLAGRAYDIGWWLLKQLCERGWEPFDGENDGTQFAMHFKKALDA